METSAAGGFVAGMRLLTQGMSLYGRGRGLVVLGIIPALISGVFYLAGLITLLLFLGDLAGLATWFADDWSPGARSTARAVAGIGILGLGLLFGALSFTAVTLLIGDPFYEKISERIEERLGGVPGAVDMPWWRSLRRSLADSGRLLLISVGIGIPLLLGGLIPLVGQTLIPVIAAVIGGWLLAVELVGIPFARRGMRLSERRAALRAHRPLALGFGVSVFLCFLVPLGAVLVMPAAVAGGTLLARHVLGQPTAE